MKIAYPVQVASGYHNSWPIFDKDGRLIAEAPSRGLARLTARAINAASGKEVGKERGGS